MIDAKVGATNLTGLMQIERVWIKSIDSVLRVCLVGGSDYDLDLEERYLMMSVHRIISWAHKHNNNTPFSLFINMSHFNIMFSHVSVITKLLFFIKKNCIFGL